MHIHARSWSLILSIALSGCAAVGPDYIKPELPLPQQWQGGNGSTLSAADTQLLAQWWRQLSDPLLDELITQALAANPDLSRAEAALREARARLGVAESGHMPTLGASASGGRSKAAGGDPHTTYSAGFDASWEADIFGATRRGIEAAQADYGYAKASLQDVQVSLAAEVALQYIQLRGYQQRLSIARANLASQSETLQITGWRVQAGLASSVELEQARGNREQTAASIPTLETGRIEAEYALAVLTGQAPGALQQTLQADQALPKLPESMTIGIPADTLRQRPDIRAAERNLAAETARIGVAEAALYPSLRLSGSIGSEAITLGALGGAETISRALLASISGTLFDGGRLRGAVDIQTAAQEQAFASYRAAVLTALKEVENALIELENNRRRMEALQRASEAARNAALLARQRYQSGLIDFQTVLETDRTRLSVEDSLASVEANRATALVQVYKALGGGWSEQAQEQTMPSRRNPS